MIVFIFFVIPVILSQLNETLREAASRCGIYIGSAGNSYHLEKDIKYKTVLAEQYDLVTPENGCKWAATEPKYNVYDYVACDTVFNFSHSSKAVFRGHNLCWGNYNPKWLTEGKFSPQEKRKILSNHIENVAGRYKGKAYVWDVVNEAVSDDGKGLKKNVWYPDIPDYIELAFNTTRKSDPNVKLFYNDYSAEEINAKSDYIYKMIKEMMKRSIPIDGVGFQMHISLKNYPDFTSFEKNLKRFSDLGLEVQVTEMDISTSDPCDDDCLKKQANLYATYLRICLDNEKCTNFETWGYTDKYSWLGEKSHPLPFDQNLKPKPSAVSLLEELQRGSNCL